MPLSYSASLKQLKLREFDKTIIANKLGFIPVSKRGGPLKPAGRAYNQAVIDEVIRRGSEQVGERKLLAQSRAPLAQGDRTRRTTTSLIKSLDRYKNVAKYLIETQGNNTLEDLYTSIIREQQQPDIKRDGAVYVNLIFEHDTDNKSRVVAIPNDILNGRDGFENFMVYLEELESGNLTKKLGKQVVGSDAINYNEYRLLLNTFIITTYRITIAGSSADIVYECKGISSETNCCGYECLALCVPPESIKHPPKYFQNFENLIAYIKEFKLPIEII